MMVWALMTRGKRVRLCCKDRMIRSTWSSWVIVGTNPNPSAHGSYHPSSRLDLAPSSSKRLQAPALRHLDINHVDDLWRRPPHPSPSTGLVDPRGISSGDHSEISNMSNDDLLTAKKAISTIWISNVNDMHNISRLQSVSLPTKSGVAMQQQIIWHNSSFVSHLTVSNLSSLFSRGFTPIYVDSGQCTKILTLASALSFPLAIGLTHGGSLESHKIQISKFNPASSDWQQGGLIKRVSLRHDMTRQDKTKRICITKSVIVHMICVPL
jgi:hypothetical protein